MQPLISIIVPVYKAEKYLSKCVESVLLQSYHHFELILIDDGSPDGSGQLCDTYAKQDSRIKVVHKQNGGVSRARNAGLDIAKGEFITFLDSDDYLECNALDIFYQTLIQEKADLVCAGHATINDMHRKRVSSLFYATFSGDAVYKNLFKIYITTPYACVKLYKASVIETKHIRFVPDIPYGEDTYFLLQYIEQIQTIAFVGDVVYYYCRYQSIATKAFHIDIDKYNLYNFLKVETIINGSALPDPEKKEILSYFACKICFENINHYMNFLNSKEIPLHKITDTFRFYRQYTDFTQNIRFPRKISPKAVRYLQEGDVDRFIRTWKRDNRVKVLKHNVKVLLTQFPHKK